MKEFELQRKFNWELAHQKIGGSGSHYLGEEYLGGIIFNLYIGSDGQQHGHVVSLTDSLEQWQTVGLTSYVGANKTYNGEYNTNLMINSPAKTWVESLGEGWYIPSIDEVNILYDNRYYVNKTLDTISGSNLLIASDNGYWSSTEFITSSIPNDAFCLIFETGSANLQSKTGPYKVRAVKSF